MCKTAEDIQLIYQGKVLLDGNTLEEVSLQPGDTIVAVIPALECEEEADKKSPLVIDGKHFFFLSKIFFLHYMNCIRR